MEFIRYFLYILLALLILLMMITIHEFGHYLAGKLLKFKINEFAIGFGPKLFSKKSKKSGEVFSIRAIPLGGYCAFEGEEAENQILGDKENKSSQDIQENNNNNNNINPNLKNFNEQPPWKRIIVLVAGGLFNLISAVIFSFIFIMAVGVEVAPAKVSYVFVNEQNVAYNDFKYGDQIIEVNGKKLTFMYNLSDAIAQISADDETVNFLVIRDGEEKPVIATKQEIIAQNGYKAFTGFGYAHSGERDNDFVTAVKYSVPYTAKMSWAVLSTLGKLFTGRVPLNQLSGPVGTVTAIAEYSLINWRVIFLLLPLIAANLGIFNLLPIPALDGSKIIFCFVEWIRKKPINQKVENLIHIIGLFALLGFVIIVDIMGIFVRCGL